MRRLLLLMVLLVTVAIPAGAEPCPPGQGVTVVVDATELKAGVAVACAPGPVETGLDALAAAGFTVEGTTRFPTFVCRIDGQPSKEQDPCVDTPPASAFWGYWHTERGGSWQSTHMGAASREPVPGGVEGWVFGSGAEPSATVPGNRSATPATTAPATTAPTTTTDNVPATTTSAADKSGDVDGPWPTILTVAGVGLVGIVLVLVRRGRDDV